MKFSIVNNLEGPNSLMAIVFCDSWHLPNVGTCHLSGHSFGRRAANASILMRFRTLHKSRAVKSMVTIVFCNFWYLSILTSVNVGTCYLLGPSFESFGRRAANASMLMKFCTRHKVRVVNSIVTIVFCDSRRLSDLTPVNIGTCHLLDHSYGGCWIQWWQ